jgi:hypothetical protein
VSATTHRPPDAEAHALPSGGLPISPAEFSPDETAEATSDDAATHTLGSLPVGARLILRCRRDWRAASVASHETELARVVLSVASPSGHTYRVRRPADSALTHEGPLPVLGGGAWRACFARYDLRW